MLLLQMDQGRGTYWEVNNCLDGLFFPLYEVIILYNKKQGLNKSCVKTETQLDCSEICLINWLHIVTYLKKSQLSNKLKYIVYGEIVRASAGLKTDSYNQ